LQILEKIINYYKPRLIKIKRKMKKEGIVHKKVALLITPVLNIRIDPNKPKKAQIKTIKTLQNHIHIAYKKVPTSKML
jgi:hypothetical protein